MSGLNEQQLVFVCSHILKLNKAECVQTMPQKRGLRPKPVPGRDCPSLKLRISKGEEEEKEEPQLFEGAKRRQLKLKIDRKRTRERERVTSFFLSVITPKQV